jgi:two-component system, NarL family, sensor histidine kinase UhpB
MERVRAVRVPVTQMQPSDFPQPPDASSAADNGAARHGQEQAEAPSRGGWRRRLSLHWRIFAGNALVFMTAAVLLAFVPVTIHAPIRLREVPILIGGLIVMLIADGALVRRTLEPLRRLATLMTVVDPMSPGRRAPEFTNASRETIALAESFNAMLDRLESERRESSRRAVAAQEAERMRIARELHDEIGQTLTAVALLAERAADQGGTQRRALSEIAVTVQTSLDDLRRISRELRPEALDDLGLVNALIALGSRIEQQSGLRVARDFEPHLPALASEIELVVYRIAQEALTNVLRHARASRVDISLRHTAGGVVLIVRDDGRGLPETLPATSGLAGMRERAMLVGAQLDIESRPDAGVEVHLAVPVAEPRA